MVYLTSLAEGTYPKYGPHGEELKGKRGKLAGQSLQKALLVEVKGDWSALKSAFRLPGWAEVDSCCFRCHANKTNLNFIQTSTSWMPAVLHRGEISPLAIGSCWCEYIASMAACLLCMELQGSNPLYLQSTGYIVVIRE